MEPWQLWQEMARESEQAARLAEDGRCPRSAASRYYYAAYQAATALLLYQGIPPPAGREAWSHADTPLLLKEHLNTLLRSRMQRVDLSRRVTSLYELRLRADYEGGETISPARVSGAGKDARYVLTVSDSVLPQRKQAP